MRFGALALVVWLGACGAKTGLEESRRAPPASDGGADAAVRDAGRQIVQPSMQCVLDGANASIEGITPFGSLELPFGWSAPQEGSCGGAILYFSSERAPLEDETGRLVPLRDGLMVAWAATVPGLETEALVTALRDGERIETRGLVVTLSYSTPGDNPRFEPTGDGFCHCDPSEERICSPPGRLGFIQGQLFVESADWFIQGSFELPHCHGLHTICI